LIANMNDEDHPVLSFHEELERGTAGKKHWITVSTRMRYYYLPAPWWVRFVVLWCKLFHRQRSFGMASAGRYLFWPITCAKDGCGCHYEIRTLNTPQWRTPWRKDLSQPRTWDEHRKAELSNAS